MPLIALSAERATRFETGIADAQKRGNAWAAKVGAPFEKEELCQEVSDLRLKVLG
jgi:hypothetical protein